MPDGYPPHGRPRRYGTSPHLLVRRPLSAARRIRRIPKSPTCPRGANRRIGSGIAGGPVLIAMPSSDKLVKSSEHDHRQYHDRNSGRLKTTRRRCGQRPIQGGGSAVARREAVSRTPRTGDPGSTIRSHFGLSNGVDLVFQIETMLRDALTDCVLPFNSDAPGAYAAVAVVGRLTAPPAVPANRQITANRGVPHAIEFGPKCVRFRGHRKGNRASRGGKMSAKIGRLSSHVAHLVTRSRSAGHLSDRKDVHGTRFVAFPSWLSRGVHSCGPGTG